MIKKIAVAASVAALLISGTTFALKAQSGYSLHNSSASVFTTDHPNGCVGIEFPTSLAANMSPATSAIINISSNMPSASLPCKTTYTDGAGDYCTIALTGTSSSNMTMTVEDSNYTHAGYCMVAASGTGVNFG
ncbi:MAG: hypothetical protein A3F11_01305 [Gammaproteobacteria bacterium RIFCSPHIGHO2_12_FULL_37_14]|nr:MAG: hypothetical protein A3F11_01305 [Gammaproteobacteria bacterium RIFCSPHIGHO2_12_FULL_37_14]